MMQGGLQGMPMMAGGMYGMMPYGMGGGRVSLLLVITFQKEGVGGLASNNKVQSCSVDVLFRQQGSIVSSLKFQWL